jgi:hypothetical protein
MTLALILLVIAIALFGVGAVVEGLLWLLAVAAILLIAGIALVIGQVRRGVPGRH